MVTNLYYNCTLQLYFITTVLYYSCTVNSVL